MTDTMHNVLFICTGNSARSIIAEALMNHLGGKRFRGYSAGSHPKGVVHPLALEALKHYRLPTDNFRSKNWDEFATEGAPPLDFVITVCDNAAGEMCPVWPGQPMTAHWGMPDPAAVEGTDAVKQKAFLDTVMAMKRRIELMLALPMPSLDRLAIQREMRRIGQR